MKMLRTCCGCCEVEIGGFIIAGFYLLGSFMTLISVFEPRQDCDAIGSRQFGMQSYPSHGSDAGEYEEMFKKLCEAMNAGGIGSTIVQSLIGFAVYGFLIAGIIKRNHYMVLPAVILLGIQFGGVALVAGIVLIVVLIIGDIGAFIGVAFVMFIVLAITWYLFHVVLSVFKKVQDEKNPTSGVVYQQQAVMSPGQVQGYGQPMVYGQQQPLVYQPTPYGAQPQSTYPMLPQNEKHEKNYP